jgi:hypothetical protein
VTGKETELQTAALSINANQKQSLPALYSAYGCDISRLDRRIAPLGKSTSGQKGVITTNFRPVENIRSVNGDFNIGTYRSCDKNTVREGVEDRWTGSIRSSPLAANLFNSYAIIPGTFICIAIEFVLECRYIMYSKRIYDLQGFRVSYALPWCLYHL